jgi:hypothetical protein
LEQTHYVRGNSDNEKSPVHNHLGQDNLLNSHSVLHAFHKSLQQSHPDSEIKKDGQSVNVKLVSYGLGIDIVPCFHIKSRTSNEQDFYYIPIGNGDPGWLKTNPKIDENISKQLHEYHNKKLKSVIKLLKYWNRVKNNERIRSYHLETIAWNIFSKQPTSIISMIQGIKCFFNNAEEYLKSNIYEATGFGGIVDKYMTPEDRQLSINEIRKAQANLFPTSALLTIEATISKWRTVFGDKFGV